MNSLKFSQDSEMVQRVKVLAAEPEDPGSIPHGGSREPGLTSTHSTPPHRQANTQHDYNSAVFSPCGSYCSLALKKSSESLHPPHLAECQAGQSSGSRMDIPWCTWLLHRGCLQVSRAGFMARCLIRDSVTHRAYDWGLVLRANLESKHSKRQRIQGNK